MRYTLLLFLIAISAQGFSQNISSVFNSAFQKFASDEDLKHATIGLMVVDLKSGKTISEINTQTGLAPASTQKTITAATAYSLLGKDFRFQTTVGYDGSIDNGKLSGDIIIKGSGDPTLGSWRYGSANEEKIVSDILNAITNAGIHQITGHVLIDENAFDGEVIPDGWIWQDLGNYYGAGARALNWRENQFDLYLASGATVGSAVKIAGTKPAFIAGLQLDPKLKAAAAGSGDNAYIYLPMFSNTGYVRGTIPVNQDKFTISGTMPHPGAQLAITIEASLKKRSIEEIAAGYPLGWPVKDEDVKNIYTVYSPPLDSICYWFLHKSINLYGEALLKTLGEKFGKGGNTREGIKVIQDFWKNEGIDDYALSIIDGSGLSPQNRITPDDLVRVLMFAKKQPWFDLYYDDLPVYNGIKMKSGSINGVLSYAGFIDGKSGSYVFSFIINNYNGGGNTMRRKMWKLLDVLK